MAASQVPPDFNSGSAHRIAIANQAMSNIPGALDYCRYYQKAVIGSTRYAWHIACFYRQVLRTFGLHATSALQFTCQDDMHGATARFIRLAFTLGASPRALRIRHQIRLHAMIQPIDSISAAHCAMHAIERCSLSHQMQGQEHLMALCSCWSNNSD